MKYPKLIIKINSSLVILAILLLTLVLATGFFIGTNYQNRQSALNVEQNSKLSNYKRADANKYSDNTKSVPPTLISPTSTTTDNTAIYTVPKTWTRTTMSNGLTLCLPPKWEADQWGNVYFNRDSAYRPNVTYIQELPYAGGSRRESFYAFWEKEYPNIRQTVGVNEVSVNKGTILKFSGPEGEKIVWLANGKLWQAGISGWSMVNDSKTTFLKDFYTMISCSFW